MISEHRSINKHSFFVVIALFLWFSDMLIISISPFVFPTQKNILSDIGFFLFSQITISMLIVIVLSFTKFWRMAGFVKPTGWVWLAWSSPLWLYTLSFFFIPNATGVQAPSQLAILVLLATLIAFSEEGIYRGVLWEALRPLGTWPTVLVTSVLFGVVHALAILWGAPPVVALSRCIYAIGGGFVFAAVRVRTGSVWPCIILHAFVDSVFFAIMGGGFFDGSTGYDEKVLVGVMIGFLVLPGIVFVMWGSFAIKHIEQHFR